jgi:hypothetical protein
MGMASPPCADALALWCDVLLAALPSPFARIVHVNLMAHWLILEAAALAHGPIAAEQC